MNSNKSVSLLDSNPIIALYHRRMDDFGRKKEQSDRWADRISHARVAIFLAAGACFLAGWFGEYGNSLWIVAGGVLSAAFVSLVWLHGRVLAKSACLEQLRCINSQAIARVLRRWRQIPLRATKTPSSEEAFSYDLDLFGESSLFHLVCTANTPMGIDTLSEWFLHPANPNTVVERQQAVSELAPALDMQQELQRRGLKIAAHKTNLDRQFLQWAESEPWLARRQCLKWTSRFLPVLILFAFIQWMLGAAPLSIWLSLLTINIVIGVVYRRQMHAIFAFISNRHDNVGHYTDLFELIAEMPVISAHLTRLHQQTAADGAEAWREIRLLGRIADMANIRFSTAHFLVQSVLSWDFHVLALLERWQRRNGQHVRRWFEVLAEWEALASFAALAHDNPTWGFPGINNQLRGEQTLSARSLGHPLIPDDRRVANDVTIGPPGTFLMVTGSNMSGKSTLLRAIGSNVVLAQAGSPACAVKFTMPPVLLATSMRIHDSLADGISYYMAELRRLKQIVDAARDKSADSGRILLYLLDEILQGTNTAERQIAVRRVLTHLLKQGAIGGVSTHDLQLAATSPISDAAKAVHFRETIHNEAGRQEMTFDYTLREGLATTSNALKLLEIVGLNNV